MTTTTDRPARVLRVRGTLLTGAAGIAAAALLAACGGGSTATTTAGSTASGPRTVAATDPAAAPGQNGQNGPGGDGGAQFQKIQECLTAAGVAVPTPTGGPGGAPPSGGASAGASGRPGGGPGGGVTQGPDGKFTAPDGDVYTAMPTPGADGRGPGDGDGGGMAQLFSDPTVKAALQACGIAVPTGRPTATSTS